MREYNYEVCGLEAVNRDWVDSLLGSLKRKFKIDALIIFGSRAIGKHTTWSDYDICVVSKDFKDMKPWERMERVLECWDGFRALEPICYTPQEFLELNNSLIREIVKTGRALLDRGVFASKKH